MALCAAGEPGRGLGLRASHAREQLLSRQEIALAWFEEEYEPVVKALPEADIGGQGTETERYMRIAMLRFLLLHTWAAPRRPRSAAPRDRPPPGPSEDTMVHQILKEMD